MPGPSVNWDFRQNSLLDIWKNPSAEPPGTAPDYSKIPCQQMRPFPVSTNLFPVGGSVLHRFIFNHNDAEDFTCTQLYFPNSIWVMLHDDNGNQWGPLQIVDMSWFPYEAAGPSFSVDYLMFFGVATRFA